MDTEATPSIARAQMLRMSALIASALGAAAIAPTAAFAAPNTPAARKAAVTVLAKVTAKPGMGQQLHDIFLGIVGPARQDPTNISYDLVQSVDDPLTFVSIEYWTSAEALQAHLKTKPITDAVAALGSVVAGPPQILAYHMVSDPV